MKAIYTSTLILLVLISTGISALDFSAKKALRDHLTEVNAEWLNYDLSNSAYDKVLHFSSENERIKAHLHEACKLILGQTCSNPERRQALIAQLKSYANAGLFPINSRHLTRRPYFIDHRGLPCAVGFLMLNNGFEKEATTVHETMNPAYIREIPSKWLQNWISYSGFSLSVLALIQPGYPPSTVWTDLGSDIVNEVTCMAVYENEVYIAGNFSLDGVPLSFAKVEGNELVELVAVNGIVNDMEVFDGQIWMAGVFNGGINDIAIWDGANISYAGAFISKFGQSYDLLNKGNTLFVSGYSTGFAGLTHSVMRLESGNWTYLGQFNGPVYSLESYDNQLIAAGEFSTFFNQEGIEITALRVATFDEVNWEPFGTGMSSTVRNLENIDNNLWACADLFDSSENPGFGLGTYNADTDVWDSYTDPDTYVIHGEPITGQGFRDIIKTDESLFTSGKFFNPGMFTIGGSIGTFTEVSNVWVFGAEVSPFLGTATDLLLHNEMLYASGDFLEFFGDYSELIRTDLSTDINERNTSNNDFVIFPNPVTTDFLNAKISLEAGDLIEIYSAEGKLLNSALFEHAMMPAKGQLRIDISSLQTGIYSLVIRNQYYQSQVRFVRQ